MNSNSLRSRCVTVDIHISEMGRGEPAVLIPGLGYASWFWQSQDPLAGNHRLLKIDPRGAGRSPKPSGPYSIDGMASDIAAAIWEAGPVHVVGHSMGGYLAQSLATNHPGLVRSITLVSTSRGGSDHDPVPEDTRSKWLAESQRPPEEYARATMPLSFRPGWPEQNPDRYEDLLARRLRHPTPLEAWQAQFEACEVFLETGADAAAIEQPALIVHGDADRVVPVDNGRRLAKTIPDARFVVFEGAGHLVPVEEAERFNRTLLDFWREHE
jgi:3-oxoadipate enol-lactonase